MDKFRGTLTAAQACAAVALGVADAGGRCDEVPMADGGEGFLDVLGGANRSTLVSGPLGDPVEAGWRMGRRRTAVVEMARASGLLLAGGAEENDPVSASTAGTGELIAAARDAGARRVLVGVGGSATTDGGLGALRALEPHARLRGVELVVACDVRVTFVQAATVFAPQKGATEKQVELLRRRLEQLAGVYLERYGVDVTTVVGSGAAGGLAGGLAAIGAQLVAGVEVVAEEVELAERIAGADLVVTGEGHLDAESFDGKTVGGVAEIAAAEGVEVVAAVGDADAEAVEHLPTIVLTREYGADRARTDAAGCLREAVAAHLA